MDERLNLISGLLRTLNIPVPEENKDVRETDKVMLSFISNNFNMQEREYVYE